MYNCILACVKRNVLFLNYSSALDCSLCHDRILLTTLSVKQLSGFVLSILLQFIDGCTDENIDQCIDDIDLCLDQCIDHSIDQYIDRIDQCI